MTSVITIPLVTAAAGADAEAGTFVPFDCEIVSASYVSHDDVAANGTNYATLTLNKNDGSGGAFAAIADVITTETVACDADTARAFTVNSAEIAAGSIVQVAKTYAASGAAMAGAVVLEVVRVHN
jgi:hypothetical protein